MCIAWSIAEKFCFPLWLHKWLSFYAEVLMQLVVHLLNVCRTALEFQRVKETLSCFNFRGPVLDFGLLYLIEIFSFNRHVVCCRWNANNGEPQQPRDCCFIDDIATISSLSSRISAAARDSFFKYKSKTPLEAEGKRTAPLGIRKLPQWSFKAHFTHIYHITWKRLWQKLHILISSIFLPLQRWA